MQNIRMDLEKKFFSPMMMMQQSIFAVRLFAHKTNH